MTDRGNKYVIAEFFSSCNSVKSDYDIIARYSAKMTQTGSNMIKRILGVALLMGMFAIPTQAAVMVTVRSTLMTEGMPATIDVFVRAQPGTTVVLDNFGLDFLITSDTPGSPRQIQFAPTQNFPGLTTDPDYVFSSVGGDPFGNILTTIFPDDTFVGGDSASYMVGTGPVTVLGTDVLLTRLQLLPGTALVGDVFTVSLVSSANTFFDDGSLTLDIPFGSTSGKVTIAAVPEPSSAAALMAMAGIGVWARRHRSRRGNRVFWANKE
jgi:hypothetical protein